MSKIYDKFEIEYDTNIVKDNDKKIKEILQQIFNDFNVYADICENNINNDNINKILPKKNTNDMINEFYNSLVKYEEELNIKIKYINEKLKI